jgi:hypothetical protein
MTVRMVRIPIIVDNISEPNEYFTCKLFNPINVVILNGTGVVIITETGLGLAQAVQSIVPAMPEYEESEGIDEPMIIPNPQTKYDRFRILNMPMGSNEVVFTDINGRVVVSLKNYQNNWSMSALSPGMYFYSISYEDKHGQAFTRSGKLIITD